MKQDFKKETNGSESLSLTDDISDNSSRFLKPEMKEFYPYTLPQEQPENVVCSDTTGGVYEVDQDQFTRATHERHLKTSATWVLKEFIKVVWTVHYTVQYGY